jgi:hypothetical protein
MILLTYQRQPFAYGYGDGTMVGNGYGNGYGYGYGPPAMRVTGNGVSLRGLADEPGSEVWKVNLDAYRLEFLRDWCDVNGWTR